MSQNNRPALIRREASFRVSADDLGRWATDEDTQRTWSEMQREAERILGQPRNVIADITFRRRDGDIAVFDCWAEWTESHADREDREADERWETRP